MFDPYSFEAIEWDDAEDPNGNLAHCLRHGVDEQVVAEVLRVHPVEVSTRLETAEFAIVGPDEHRQRLWTLLFDTSNRRDYWFRSITGWQSKEGRETVATDHGQGVGRDHDD